MNVLKPLAIGISFALLLGAFVHGADRPAVVDHGDHLVFEGGDLEKHAVLVSGDEEYRSEEALPMLGELLAKAGFKVTVLFSLNEEGFVDPDVKSHLSHPEALDSADLILLSIRFRHWEDKAMEHFDQALKRGVPVIGLRTSTHGFSYGEASKEWGQKWGHYTWRASSDLGWEKGFGYQVLGQSWLTHHGKHGKEGTRTRVVVGAENHPILKGVGEIFCTSDVYETNVKDPHHPLLVGLVTETLEPDSGLVDEKNDPAQCVAWTRQYVQEDGTSSKVFATTMGAATDFLDPDLRRLVVNAAFWAVDLEVPDTVDVSVPEGFNPSPYRGRWFKKGLKPIEFVIGSEAFEKASLAPIKKKK